MMSEVHILFKILIYSMLYILPRVILGKKVDIRNVIIFLCFSLYLVPVAKNSLIENPELQDSINGYTDAITALAILW